MQTCRTRPSTSQTATSPSTSARRSLPAATSRRPSSPPCAAMSTFRKAAARVSTRSSFALDLGKGRKVRFVGILLGEWVTLDSSRVRHLPRLPQPNRQVRPPRRAQRRLHDGQRRRQAGRLARLPGHRQRQLRIVARRLDDRDHQLPSMSCARSIPPQLYEMVAFTAEQPPVEDLDI